MLSANLYFINLHLKGGIIIPTQEPNVTTMDSRINPLGLIVSLDENSEATGELYWDEGDSLKPLETGMYSLVEFEFKGK